MRYGWDQVTEVGSDGRGVRFNDPRHFTCLSTHGSSIYQLQLTVLQSSVPGLLSSASPEGDLLEHCGEGLGLGLVPKLLQNCHLSPTWGGGGYR